MGNCQNHLKLCTDGVTHVAPDPFNNCEWHSCPYDRHRSACTQEMGTCPDGSYVSRDFNNVCKFERCPDGFVYLGNEITEGQKILSGEGLLSDNNKYKAVMQTDGNFVVYKLDPSNGNIQHELWHSYMNGEHSLSSTEGRYMIYQNDNNFCMYAAADTGFRWCTMHYQPNVPTGAVIMQDDSNLCVYNGHGHFLWGSYQDGGIYAGDTTVVPFNVEIMGVVLALLCIINIFVGAYFYCCNNQYKKRKEVATFQFDDKRGLIVNQI
eukprot:21520_1